MVDWHCPGFIASSWAIAVASIFGSLVEIGTGVKVAVVRLEHPVEINRRKTVSVYKILYGLGIFTIIFSKLR